MTEDSKPPQGRKVLRLPNLADRRKAVSHATVDAEIKALNIRYDRRVANQRPPPTYPEGWTAADQVRYEVALLEAHIVDYVPAPEDANDRDD